jgi:hypothetical protein
VKFTAILLVGVTACITSVTQAAPKASASPGFYTQSVEASGITIRASSKADPATLQAVKARLDKMLAHAPGIAANLKAAKVELHVIARGEVITDLPEYQALRGKMLSEGITFERRFHGGKATGTLIACTEENAMHDKTDPYPHDYDVCTHESAHVVMAIGLDPQLREKIIARYAVVLGEGLYENVYAGKSFNEFFAEGSARYFGYSGGGLQQYDPTSYALIDSLYSGRVVPVASPVVDLVPLSSAATEQAHSPEIEGQWSSGIILKNKSATNVRLSQLDSKGHLLTSSSRVIIAGSEEQIDEKPRFAVLVMDDKTKGTLAVVVTQNDFGRLVVDDKMVRAQRAPSAEQLERASSPTRY